METEIESFLLKLEDFKLKAHFPENELTQHLVELGYIRTDMLQLMTPVNKQLVLDEFWSDLEGSEIFSKEKISFAKLIYADEVELYFLRLLKDLDEGIILKELPPKGTKNLVSRIIHYRLDIIGLLDGSVEKEYDEISVLNLHELASQLGEKSLLRAINAFADMEQLTEMFIRKIGKENCILIFRLSETNKNLRKFEKKQAFKRTIKEEFSRKSSFYRKIKDTVIRKKDKKVDYKFLQNRLNSKLNSFLIRLIQIHQWMDGSYQGLLDSELGDVSFESILESIRLFNDEKDKDDIKSKEVIFHAGKGYFIFNALFFLEEYKVENKKLDYQGEVVAMINSNLIASTEEEVKVFNKNVDKISTESFNNSERILSERKGLLQRIYYGVKSFFKKAFKIGQRIFRWIRDNLKKAFSFLKDFFRKLFMNLGKALYYFKEGILYILGINPLIKITSQNHLLASKIQIDGDANCFVSSGCGIEEIKAYKKRTSETIHSMVFSLKVVTLVIKTVQYLVSFLSWPLLLMNIVKSYSEIVKEYKLITN